MANDLNSLEDFFKGIRSRYTPEYLAQLERDCYEDDRHYPENFSNWYPHIKSFGTFNHAEIISNQIFTLDECHIMQEEENKNSVDWEKWLKILAPTLSKMKPHVLYSIKNGTFSNKFNFASCVTTKMELAQNLWDINYASHTLDTGGYTELVVRELIPYDSRDIPTIYNGMPLREEVRVFYNMDTKAIEYMVDYWDYDYCADSIRDKTDKIIFDWFHTESDHHTKLEMVMATISDNINTLKFDASLKGIWSIDFMYDAKTAEIYLIDMARGFRSAYWNVDKLTYSTRKKK